MAEIDTKLDEDFLFYMNFLSTFLKRISDPNVLQMSGNWAFKLCTDPCESINMKRCRNMYLANLLICMQNGKLKEPFLKPPFSVDISDAMEVFNRIEETVEKPDWFNDKDFQLDGYKQQQLQQQESKSGRTYFATRTLPNGQGAFAYIGISLTGDDWIRPFGAAGDLNHPNENAQLEKILSKRKCPNDRKKVLTFYDVLLQNVADELDGKATTFNETIEGLLEQLIQDLQVKNVYENYEVLNDYDRRLELLMLLYDRVKTRRDKLAKREHFLDDIEKKVVPNLLQIDSHNDSHLMEGITNDVDDEYLLPAVMWQQEIDKMPNKQQMDHLRSIYPIIIVEHFLTYLALFKEDIANKIQRNHERIVKQMKKELRNEGMKKKNEAEKLEMLCTETENVYAAVIEQYRKQLEMIEANRLLQTNQQQDDEQLKIFNDIKSSIRDTQKLVEEYAGKGKFLAKQINDLIEQNEQLKEDNEMKIKNAEFVNSENLRNIKRLNHTIQIYENRIDEIRSAAEQSRKKLLFNEQEEDHNN